jgi:acetoin utilization protein AcuB
MKASELLSNVLITVGPNALLDDARETLSQCKVRHLPVVQDGRVVGMLSDRDVAIIQGRVQQPNCVTGLASDQDTRIPMRVSSIMSAPVWCVDTTSDVGEIIDMTREYCISAVPVTRQDKLVGIITTTDLLRCFVDYCKAHPLSQACRDTVAVCMSEPPVIAELNDYAQIVLASMVRTQSYYCMVIQDNRLVGIISDRDLRSRLGVTIRGSLDNPPELDSAHGFTTATHVMTANPKTASPDTLLSKAASLMLEQRIGSLPIVKDDGSVVGLLKVNDIIQVLRPLVAEEDRVLV